MTRRKRQFARWRAALLVVSALLCGVSYAVPRMFPAGEAARVKLARLETERDRLRLIVDQPHKEESSFQWTDSALAALPTSLGPGWHWAEAPSPASTTALLVCSHSGLDEWANIVAAVETLHAHPGLVVNSAAITASGLHRQRHFGTISIGVRLRTGGIAFH